MLKILIVDDEAVVRHGIALGIDWAQEGCAVVAEAANGAEGIEAVHRYHPNLIITDVRMPHMDGLEMMKQLRAEGCEAHAIILTAYSDFEYARSAIQFGAVDYLLKPFENEDLIASVRKVLELDRRQASVGTDPLKALPKGDKSRIVMQAMSYIAEHYADQGINISTIAEAVSVSEGHLSHAFKKETSYTVNNYLTGYRVHQAIRLLKDPAIRVYEVAEQVGYRDVAYFCSIFKKNTGVSPSEYQDHWHAPVDGF
ncbi:MAG: response regulator [[Clostridium] aminophilum]|uniref:response regulator transcription factor n=1 Tax=[Clostridium] aminophilum TaxID=1526 RepID=UPI0026EE2D81|nr:response regulator [[Clostridium] aminophilum]MDD6196191.1 response regulator [[Clostridium] aminophilum]